MGSVDVGVALETLDIDSLVVLVFLFLGSDGELRDLCWRFISSNQLALSAYVQDEEVRSEGGMEGGVLARADATAVEALQADIKAVLVVDGIEALGAILSVD